LVLASKKDVHPSGKQAGLLASLTPKVDRQTRDCHPKPILDAVIKYDATASRGKYVNLNNQR
jgi:hypothetical protein